MEVTLVPGEKLQIINSAPHHSREAKLVQVPFPNGGLMWVHPDLIEDEGQWTVVSNKKSKGKVKVKPFNIVSASLKETDSDLVPLTDIKQENIVISAQTTAPLTAAT